MSGGSGEKVWPERKVGLGYRGPRRLSDEVVGRGVGAGVRGLRRLSELDGGEVEREFWKMFFLLLI